jgi:hypothetical protein
MPLFLLSLILFFRVIVRAINSCFVSSLFIVVVVELVVVSVVHIGLIRSDTGHMLYTRTLYGLKLYLNATSGAICLLS